MKKITSLLAAAFCAMSFSLSAQSKLVVSGTYEPAEPLAITKNWTTELSVPATTFKNSITEKSVLRFYFNELGANPQVQIVYKADDAKWTWTVMAKCADITGSPFDYTIADAIDDMEGDTVDMGECVAGIKAHGLYLKGQDFSISKIEILNPEGEEPEDPMKGYELSSTYDLPEPIVITGWKETSIGNEGFAKLTAKSFIKLKFTDCGANPQVQIAYKSGEGSKWTQLNAYVNVDMNEFTFPLSDFKDAQDAATYINKRGMILKGQQCTLSAIEVYNPEGETPDDPMEGYIVSSTYDLNPPLVQTSWKELTVPSAAFKNLINESVVRLVFGELGTDPQIQIAYKADNAQWTWTEFNKYDDIAGQTYDLTIAEFADPADAVAGIKAHGLWIKGQNYTLTQVIILNPEGVGPEPQKEMEVTETFEPTSPMVIVSWDSEELSIPASAFKTLTLESAIHFYFTDCTGGQAQICYKADDAAMTWTKFSDYTEIEAGKIEITVKEFADPEGALAGIKANGMFLKGQKYTLAKIEVLNPKQSGIDSIVNDGDTAIDWNAPVEIYNLMGVRVSEMNAGNIYIVRQGANVAKIVK